MGPHRLAGQVGGSEGELVKPTSRLTMSTHLTIVSAHLVYQGWLQTTIENRQHAVSGWGLRRIRKGRFPLRFKETRREIVALAGAVLVIACAALAQPPQENQIHVEIAGLRNDKGRAVCSLFSSASDFPKKTEKAVAHTTAVITDRHAVCEFSGVAPGTYAISVFHDENSNGKLDTNFMGIPREGVGASNGAKGHLGPPKFDAAAFHFGGGRLELKIAINYL
jgi:uncharacterized protein (DUF2141 family)